MFKLGAYVQTFFDTGAMGVSILYGVVIASGPKTARVRWEPGLTNRIDQDNVTVKPAEDQQTARDALKRFLPE